MNEGPLAADPGAAWSVWLQGATQFWRVAPRGGSLTMLRAGLALSGEVELVMNWGVVDFSETAGAALRDLVAALRVRRLPAYLFFTSTVAPALKELALRLGLEAAGSTPLMVRDTGPVVARSPALTVSHVHGENELRLFARIAADAFEVAPAAVNVPSIRCGCVFPMWTYSWAATASAPSAAALPRGRAAGRGSGLQLRPRLREDAGTVPPC